MKCKKCWICWNAKRTDDTVRKKCTLTSLQKKKLKCFQCFHSKQKAKFWVWHLRLGKHLCDQVIHRQSNGTLTSLFCSCRIRVVPCLCRYCFNGNALITQNSGDLTVAALHTHLKLPGYLFIGIHWRGDKKQQQKKYTQQTTVRHLCGTVRLLANATTTTANRRLQIR